MIVAISDDVLSDPVDSNTCQTVELSIAVSICTEFTEEISIRVEDLNTMIRWISNNDEVVGPYRNTWDGANSKQ